MACCYCSRTFLEYWLGKLDSPHGWTGCRVGADGCTCVCVGSLDQSP